MRRVMLLLALALIVSACAGAAQDGGSAEDTGPATTAAETTTTAPAATTTTAAPATTTTVADQSLESTFATAAFTPPDVFESYVSEVVMTIALGEGAIEVAGEGSWVGDAFECTMTMSVGGFGLSQGVVATEDAIWFDDGTGYVESAVNSATETVVASCPAAPQFWDDFVSAGRRPLGQLEEFAGRPAIKVDLVSVVDFGGSLGVIPEVQDATINQMEMWVDEETNVVLGLYADVAVAPGSLGDLGIPGDEAADTVSVIMDLSIDRINDPAISITIPTA